MVIKIKPLTQLKKVALSSFLIGAGYGITLHAIAGELYDKAGIGEILCLQGEWIGMAVLAIGIMVSVLLLWDLDEE